MLTGLSASFSNRIGTLWRWLTEPASSIEGIEHRRRAQLFSSLLVALLIAAFFVIGFSEVMRLSDEWRYDNPEMSYITLLIVAGIYGWSRTRYYRSAALLCIVFLFVVIHMAAFMDSDSAPLLMFVFVPLLLAGFLFSALTMFLVTVTSLVVTLLVVGSRPDLMPAVSIYIAGQFYLVSLSSIIAAYLRHRNLLERDRQAEVRQIYESTQESAARLRALVENAPVMIVYTDREGRIEFVNNVPQGKPEDVIGKTVFDATPPDQHDRVQAAIDKVLTMGVPAAYEVVWQQPENSESHLSTQVGPVVSAGRIVGLTFITTDITGRVRAEQEREQLHQEIIEAQQETLIELSSPVIPVMEGIIVMPLIGNIDSRRAQNITRSLLQGVGMHGAKVVILDITGVSLVDSEVAGHLDKTVRAARLKGARTIIAGISDAVAETIVDLGIDWSELETVRDLQTGLRLAMRKAPA